METCYLFVYGSLLLGIDTPITRFLATYSKFVGEGVARGQLFDLGSYPGFHYLPHAHDSVSGHVLKLTQEDTVFSVLDEYEGVRFTMKAETPVSEDDTDEYRRIQIEVFCQDKPINAWCYVLNKMDESYSRIPSGKYLEYLKDKEEHKQFLKNLSDHI